MVCHLLVLVIEYGFCHQHHFFITAAIERKNPRNSFIKIMNNYSFFLDNYLSEGIIKMRVDCGL